jgi:hypothetical protein
VKTAALLTLIAFAGVPIAGCGARDPITDAAKAGVLARANWLAPQGGEALAVRVDRLSFGHPQILDRSETDAIVRFPVQFTVTVSAHSARERLTLFAPPSHLTVTRQVTVELGRREHMMPDGRVVGSGAWRARRAYAFDYGDEGTGEKPDAERAIAIDAVRRLLSVRNGSGAEPPSPDVYVSPPSPSGAYGRVDAAPQLDRDPKTGGPQLAGRRTPQTDFSRPALFEGFGWTPFSLGQCKLQLRTLDVGAMLASSGFRVDSDRSVVDAAVVHGRLAATVSDLVCTGAPYPSLPAPGARLGAKHQRRSLCIDFEAQLVRPHGGLDRDWRISRLRLGPAGGPDFANTTVYDASAVLPAFLAAELPDHDADWDHGAVPRDPTKFFYQPCEGPH